MQVDTSDSPFARSSGRCSTKTNYNVVSIPIIVSTYIETTGTGSRFDGSDLLQWLPALSKRCWAFPTGG
jgi:hypothetical protein